MTTPLKKELVFKEVATYILVFGPYTGKYVAECAESRCGYLGKWLLSPEYDCYHLFFFIA
jgi:hypothetical protein